MRSWLYWWVLVCATWTSSCFEALRWEHQSLHLRYDAATDTARVLVVYEGVSRGTDGTTAMRAVEAIAAKKRYFALVDWPFEFDLDGAVKDVDLEREITESRAADTQDPRIAVLELARGITVLEAGAFVADQKLALAQVVKLPQFGAFVERLNDWCNANISQPGDVSRPSDLTEEEWSAWRAKAARKERWLVLTPDALEVRFPYSPRLLAEAVVALHRSPNVGTAVFDSLDELAVENGEIVFRFHADQDGVLSFRFGPPHGRPTAYSDELRQAVESAGTQLEPVELEDAISDFRK